MLYSRFRFVVDAAAAVEDVVVAVIFVVVVVVVVVVVDDDDAAAARMETAGECPASDVSGWISFFRCETADACCDATSDYDVMMTSGCDRRDCDLPGCDETSCSSDSACYGATVDSVSPDCY